MLESVPHSNSPRRPPLEHYISVFVYVAHSGMAWGHWRYWKTSPGFTATWCVQESLYFLGLPILYYSDTFPVDLRPAPNPSPALQRSA